MADGIKIRELTLTNTISNADVFVIDKLNNITGENLTFQISFEDIKKNYLGDVSIEDPQTNDLLVYDGEKWINQAGGAPFGGQFEGSSLIFRTTHEPVILKVTVGMRTVANRFYNDASTNRVFYINGEEAPSIALAPGIKYRFDTSDVTCQNYNFRFFTVPTNNDIFTPYTYGVDSPGTPGEPGSYTELVFTQEYEESFGKTSLKEESPRILFYNCVTADGHDFMGNGVMNMGKIQDVDFGTGGDDDLIITPMDVINRIKALESQLTELTNHVGNLFTIE